MWDKRGNASAMSNKDEVLNRSTACHHRIPEAETRNSDMADEKNAELSCSKIAAGMVVTAPFFRSDPPV